ncbi:hypothetical protein [Hymenobacter rubidus]|uniref:hypothetical protein n=1 Tax=Hymenobacter rubidus TaxID=1441626 RepID=UPI00191CCBA0|nr:hypothetical protein [Hymenobacter rubidus]
MQPEATATTIDSRLNDKRKFLISALNGTGLYVLAYYLVWGLHEAAKFGISSFYHLRGKWDPSRITYTIADNEWWRTAVVAVYGMGPAVCLAAGLVAFWWYWKKERARRGQFKLFLLWIALHACNAVFGALLADTFTHSGFWYVPDWLINLGNAVDVILALLAGMTQLALGYFAAVAFLQAHDSKTVMRYSNRQWMVLSTLVAPWVVGSLFISATKGTYLTVQEGLHMLMMVLLLIPLALGCLNETFESTVRRAQATHVVWGLVVLAVVVALVWRVVLSPPVMFG